MSPRLPFTGGCVCGAVRYVCSVEPRLMLNCHCRDCQRTGGGAYAPILVVPWDTLCWIGEVRRFATTRMSGNENRRGFCPGCGSRLTVGEDPVRNLAGLLAAGLDDPSWFCPTMDIFTADAQPWDTLDPTLPRHPQHRPR